VTVADALDYETATSHTITVKATSSDGSETSADFTLNVTDDVQDNLITVTSPTVNEASPHTYFSVSGAPDQIVVLTLVAGSAEAGGIDFGAGDGPNITVSIDGGLNWSDYLGGPVVLSDTGNMLVRMPLVDDDIADNNETFTLIAANTGGTTSMGTATINDDGTGTIFLPDGSSDPAGQASDDRALTITNPTVNEASPFAVFTVTGAPGQDVRLALAGDSATENGTDFGAPGVNDLQVSNDGGVTWNDYVPGALVALDGIGGTLLVRTPIIEDGIQDNNETFMLSATPSGGRDFFGTATINDEGVGDIFNPNGSLNTIAVKSDDRPLPPPVPDPVPEPVIPPPEPSPPAEPAAPEVVPPLTFDDGLTDNAGELKFNPSESTTPQETSSQSEEHELRLDRNIPDQPLQPGSELAFTIPADTFSHTDAQATVILNAAMLDGSPLPSWLSFDPNRGQFSGSPPANVSGEIQIKIVARDDTGRQAETIVRIVAASGDAPPSISTTPTTSPDTPTSPAAMPETPPSGQGSDNQGSATQQGEVRTTSGFPVQVSAANRTGGEHELLLDKAIPDQQFPAGASTILFVVPTDAFVHTDSLARVELFAQMVDGTSLPDWLVFDKEKGEFKGVPPTNFQGELLIKVIARDEAGRQAETIVRIRVGEKAEQVSLKGKPTLTAQLKAQGVFAWKAERDNLVQQARDATHKVKLERLKAEGLKAEKVA